MRIEPEISSVGVVVRGDFNPAIFTPAWFALHALLPEGVAGSADLKVAHPQATIFSTEWLDLQVMTDRFTANTDHAPYVRLPDLVVRVFKEHLPHTPLRAIGINRDVHFCVKNMAERNRIGRKLAPVEPWGCLGKELGLDSEHGGMRLLRMSQTHPAGRPQGGEINVTVEPSARIGEERPGIHIGVNDHYEAESERSEGRTQLIDFLEEGFESSIRRGDEIIDHIMSLATD